MSVDHSSREAGRDDQSRPAPHAPEPRIGSVPSAVSAPEEPGEPTAGPSRVPRPGVLEWLTTVVGPRLFPPAVTRRLTWPQVVLATVAVLAATAVGLGRVRGPGSWDTIMAEDGRDLLHDAYQLSLWGALSNDINGYYQTGPRLLAEIAAAVPVRWAAAVLAVEATAATALLALVVYIASGAHLRHPLARLLAAAPMIVFPVSLGTVEATVVTVQFPLLYAACWVLLWVPARRAGWIVAGAVVAAVAFGTILALGLIPLVVARVVIRRTWRDLVLGGIAGAGVLLQVGALVLGFSDRGDMSSSRVDPLWLLEELIVWGVPHSLMGERWMGQAVGHTREYLALQVIAWLLLAAVWVVALMRWTDANWPLAAVTTLHGLGFFALTLTAQGAHVMRYLTIMVCFLAGTFAALLRPYPDARARAGLNPLVAITVFIAVLMAVNYRTDFYRAQSPRWSVLVDQATAACVANPELDDWQVQISPRDIGVPFTVDIPCDRLR